jgi:hypothetical protein
LGVQVTSNRFSCTNEKKYKQGAFLNVHLLFLVSNQSSSDEDIDDEKDEDDEVTDRDLR